MSILHLIASDGFISVNKTFIKLLGLDAAVILGELASEHNYWEREGKLKAEFFYSTAENLEENTGLSRHQQTKAINKLIEVGIIEVRLMGIPSKKYFKINKENLLEVVKSKVLKNLKARVSKIEKLDCENFESLDVKNLKQIRNKELEITKENEEKEIREQIEFQKPTVKINFDLYADTYNTYCFNLPKIKALTEKRKTAIRKFAKEFSLDDFKDICVNANNSNFLIGNNDRGWKADFDFLLRTDKAVAILEGKFNDHKAEKPKSKLDAALYEYRMQQEREKNIVNMES